MKLRASNEKLGFLWVGFSSEIEILKDHSIPLYLLALSVVNHGGSRTLNDWVVEDISYYRRLENESDIAV